MKRARIYLMLFLGIFNKGYGYDIISLYLKPYPFIEDKKSSSIFVQDLGKPGKLAKHQLRFVFDKTIPSGIFALYAGYIALSDLMGHVTFPYRHTKPFVYILITDHITPIVMFFNTLKNWELEYGTPAQMFKMERKQDEETKQWYWDVEQISLPEDGNIPLETIIILAKPKHIYIPVGVTLTEESPHLLLPDIYVRKGINKTQNALYILNLRQFFGSGTVKHKMEKHIYHQKIAP